MAVKLHCDICDICDAVVPDDQEYVYLVRKSEYHKFDWRMGSPAIGCYPCLAEILSSIPKRVEQGGQ